MGAETDRQAEEVLAPGAIAGHARANVCDDLAAVVSARSQIRPRQVLALQRTAGNRAVTRLLLACEPSPPAPGDPAGTARLGPHPQLRQPYPAFKRLPHMRIAQAPVLRHAPTSRSVPPAGGSLLRRKEKGRRPTSSVTFLDPSLFLSLRPEHLTQIKRFANRGQFQNAIQVVVKSEVGQRRFPNL